MDQVGRHGIVQKPHPEGVTIGSCRLIGRLCGDHQIGEIHPGILPISIAPRLGSVGSQEQAKRIDSGVKIPEGPQTPRRPRETERLDGQPAVIRILVRAGQGGRR